MRTGEAARRSVAKRAVRTSYRRRTSAWKSRTATPLRMPAVSAAAGMPSSAAAMVAVCMWICSAILRRPSGPWYTAYIEAMTARA